MTSALFEHIDVNHTDNGVPRRRRALGGAVQALRARQGWKVADAAVAAHVAPMTFRRIEDGLTVRERTYLAVDTLLGVAPGTVHRALRDDRAMVDIVRRAGVDVAHVAPGTEARFLDTFGRHAVPTLFPTGVDQPEVTPDIAAALRLASLHVSSNRPTPLELAHRLVEQLVETATPTPAVKALLRSALEAIPDLIAAQLVECEGDVRATAETTAAEAAHLVAS